MAESTEVQDSICSGLTQEVKVQSLAVTSKQTVHLSGLKTGSYPVEDGEDKEALETR